MWVRCDSLSFILYNNIHYQPARAHPSYIKHPCHPPTTSPSSQCYTIITIFFKILKVTCVVSLATMPIWASSLSSWPSSSSTPSSSDWRERRPWHFEWLGCNFGGKGHLCTNMYYIRNFNQKIDNRYYIKWATVLIQNAYICITPFELLERVSSFSQWNSIPFSDFLKSLISLKILSVTSVFSNHSSQQ